MNQMTGITIVLSDALILIYLLNVYFSLLRIGGVNANKANNRNKYRFG